MTAEPLAKAYDASAAEARWYPFWMERGHFHAPTDSDKPPFVIMIPLPNVTGTLHMGHALMVTIQDILIRHRRMKGHNALWMPGTEHHQLESFYARVRPPGWWRQTARAIGEPPGIARQRLIRGAAAIIACAFSVYGTLIGVAQLTVQRADWSTYVMLAGALLIAPYWLRFVRHGVDGVHSNGG